MCNFLLVAVNADSFITCFILADSGTVKNLLISCKSAAGDLSVDI